MAAPAEPPTPAQTAELTDAQVHSRLRGGYFLLGGLNSLATSYYFNYLFFYMEKHFGFGNRQNLLITALYGLTYMCGSWHAGYFGPRRGYFFTLRVAFIGMMVMMAICGVAPYLLGYTHATMLLEWAVVAIWTPIMCLTWPTLQALLSREQRPGEGSRTAGIYNVMWASATALAYLTSGALLEIFGGEILFWAPAGIHLLSFLLLPRLQTLEARARATEEIPDAKMEIPEREAESVAKAKSFLWLAWIANPFAYVGVYGLIPVIPKLAERFALTPTYAGVVCSVWFWTRLVGFAWFWRWTGWHYSFRWLLGAFLGLIASFITILLGTQIWMLVVAQIIFGLAVSLIYYSSLFYSLDAGTSKGGRGGFHEAAIGLGIFIGPTAGVTALHLFPGKPDAGTWGMSLLLVVGLVIFLYVRRQGMKMTQS